LPAAQRTVERHEIKVAQAAAVAKMREAQDKTLAAMLRAYVAGLRSRDKHGSAYDAANMFTNHVERAFPDLAELPAASIRPEHVTRILSRLVGPDVEDKKGRTALKLRSCMAAAFKQALGASTDPMAPASAAGFGLTSNPAAAVPATTMAAKFNRAGERVLSVDELRRYMAHVDALPSSFQRLALRLQLATGGQRIRQLLRLTRDDIGAKSLMLYDPKGKRQEARRHELPLIAEAAELVDAVINLSQADDENESPILFSARGAPMAAETLSAAVHEISAAMVHSGEAAGTFRGGDIRRTVETMLGERLGIDKDTRAQLLSHGLSGVQDRHYDRGAYLETKTAALRKWNDFLSDLCIGHPEESGKVVSIRRSA
ncbi:MAG: tyrosine-type recombinase/integrase, partial [Gammaproteobacteria bacterium]|nr:tyrosine-type recombinase/integrase [Gammaproteobacteria bacterium]